jgi:hypothetical protein
MITLWLREARWTRPFKTIELDGVFHFYSLLAGVKKDLISNIPIAYRHDIGTFLQNQPKPSHPSASEKLIYL